MGLPRDGRGELLYRVSRFFAVEGQAFVLVATQVLTEGNLEKNHSVFAFLLAPTRGCLELNGLSTLACLTD